MEVNNQVKENVHLLDNCTYCKFYDNYYYQIDTLNLIIEINLEQFDLSDVIKKINSMEISFDVLCYNLLTVGLDFFTNLFGYTLENSIITIPIDIKMFFSQVLFDPKLFFSIKKSNINNNFSISLKSKIILKKPYSGEIEYSCKHIQHLQNKSLTLSNNVNKKVINSTGLLKGFYLVGDIKLINGLKIQINDYELFYYDELMINLISVKKSENMLYVPLDYNIDPENNDYNSYRCSLNLSRICDTKLEIYTNNPNDDSLIKIYLLISNQIVNCCYLLFY